MLPHNPVHPHNFPDPFVLRTEEGYFAYGTDLEHAGGDLRLPILHSTDLRAWAPRSHAVRVCPATADKWDWWAPEVAAHAGRYFIYHAVAYRTRVAVADHPAGPFVDAGVTFLPDEPFVIDAHPFLDPVSGDWFLYLVVELLEGPHAARPGVGIVGGRLRPDMLGYAEPPVVVLAPGADWQTFETQRHHKGRVWPRWHTIEGPCMRHHAGRYWLMYSGGNYNNDSYGVSVAEGASPLGPFLDHGLERGPCVLRSIPGELIGPGHHSVTRDPAGDEVIVYHAWDRAATGRMMCVDRLDWTPTGPVARPTAFRHPA